MFSIAIDDRTRAVRVLSAGTWTPSDADRYVADFTRRADEARERFGSLRVLVDARGAANHREETAKRLAVLGRLFNTPGDRLALVTTTSLKKQQVGRTMPAYGMVFQSISAAETWLLAHDFEESDAA